MPEVALVTGGTGAVGPLLVDALLGRGYSVRVLSRQGPPAGLFDRRVVVLRGDVTKTADVQQAMRGVGVVYNLAAMLHVNSPGPALRPLYEAVNIDGTRNVVNEAARAGVRRVVQFSTIAVYGSTGGRIVAEDTPACPETIYAETKARAEEVARAVSRPNGEPIATILRFAAVYGARVKGNYRRLLHAIAMRRFVQFGRGRNRRTLIYEKDVATAAVEAGAATIAAGRTYNVSDCTFHTVEEIIEAIAAALSVRPTRIDVPDAITDIAELTLRIFGRAGIKPFERAADLLAKFREDVAVDGSRIRRELAFTPRYALRDGWAEAIRELDRCGELSKSHNRS